MDAYKKLIVQALMSDESKLPVEVEDIFAVPDYVSLLEPCMDTRFGRYAKCAWTQLQWKFEAIQPCADFPLGVKTTYRAYAQDQVNEIVSDSTKVLGYAVHNCHVKWFPEAEEASGVVEGMYILNKFPTDPIQAEAFLPNSKELLDSVYSKVSSHYTPEPDIFHRPLQQRTMQQAADVGEEDKMLYGDKIVAEWLNFLENIAPRSNHVNEYCEEHPLHVPLRGTLFSTPLNRENITPRVNNKIVEAIQTQTLDSVMWSRRGASRTKNHLANKQARALLEPEKEAVSTYDPNSDSDSSYSNEYVYKPLTQAQKHQFRYEELLTYVGKKFKDTDEEGDIIEAKVDSVVIETTRKIVCFKYFELKDGDDNDNDPQYIVADQAIEECDWFCEAVVGNKSNLSFDNCSAATATSNMVVNASICKQKRSKGWHYLEDGEDIRVAQLDKEVDIINDAGRNMRQRKK